MCQGVGSGRAPETDQINRVLLSSLEAAEFPAGSGGVRSGSSSEETAPVQNINFQSASRI